MMRRTLRNRTRRSGPAGLFAALILSLAELLFSGKGAAAAETVIKLNEVIRSLFYTPQYVAFGIRAFASEGLKVDGPKTTWGTQAALTEIVSGNSNIVLIGPEAATLTLGARPDRRLVNFAQLTNGDGSFILSKTPIVDFKIADLKGKTIVTSGVGSTPSLALVHLIKKANLDSAKDVTVRYIPISSNIIPSYLDSSASFAQAFEPSIVQAVNQNKGYRVASVGTLLGPMPYTAYAAPAAYVEKNPAIIQSFTNAIYKGLLWTNGHSASEIAALVGPYFKDVPQLTIEVVIAEYKKVNIWPTSPVIGRDGMGKMIGLMKEGGILKQEVTYEQVVKPHFAEEAVVHVR